MIVKEDLCPCLPRRKLKGSENYPDGSTLVAHSNEMEDQPKDYPKTQTHHLLPQSQTEKNEMG